MAATISIYYSDELLEWNNSIIYYYEEISELEQKLEEVIRRNSIVGIAEKVEAQQAMLNTVSDKFYQLQMKMKQQQDALKTDSTMIDDAKINTEIEERQNKLRNEMHFTEKKYIDIKYNCYNFLSGILKK